MNEIDGFERAVPWFLPTFTAVSVMLHTDHLVPRACKHLSTILGGNETIPSHVLRYFMTRVTIYTSGIFVRLFWERHMGQCTLATS